MTLFVIVASVVCALPAIADEGMWPFNQFPKDAVAEKHKLDVTPFLRRAHSGTLKTLLSRRRARPPGQNAFYRSPIGL